MSIIFDREDAQAHSPETTQITTSETLGGRNENLKTEETS